MPYLTGQVLSEADIAALFTSGTYTPTLGAMVIGTGGTPTNSAKFTFVGFPAGGVLTVEGKIKFGTAGQTFPAASAETISLPAGYSLIETSTATATLSLVTFVDSSTGAVSYGAVFPNTATTVRPLISSVSGSFITAVDVAATTPFAWASGDEINYRFAARCTGP